MPSQTKQNDLFSREIEVCSKVLKIDQLLEGDVHCVVWDAALVLSKFLEKLTFNGELLLNGLNVLELGSGLGCVGLTAACLGANVILSDLPEALPLLQKNIDNNLEVINSAKGSAVAKIINWGETLQFDCNFKPHLILLADCVYYSEAVKKLVKSLVDLSLLNKDTIIYVSQEERDTIKQTTIWSEFLLLIEGYFHLNEVPFVDHHPEFRSHDIKIFQLKFKL